MSGANRTRGGRSREEVAAAALALVDEQGLDALSMRRLADRLGIGTMTLYGHFRSKDELLDALVEAAAGAAELDPPAAGDWQERLRLLARAWRTGLERHPALVELRLRRPILTPGALRGTEAGLQALTEAGYDVPGAVRAFRTLFLYVFAFATFGDRDPVAGSGVRTNAAIAALPPEEFPILSGAGPELAASLGGDEQFDDGLELLLGGLAARVARR